MSAIWFTSDTHFSHANIIKYCKRPFASVEEMDAALVDGWNDTVGPDDTVYHLGDFTLGDIKRFVKWVSRLNGQIKVLPGSHDHGWLADFMPEIPSLSGHPVEILPPLVSLEFPELGGGEHPQVIVLCHYAMRAWDRSHYGAWHLYGHSHGTLPGYGLSFEVSVDCCGFRPISLASVADRMKELKALAHIDTLGKANVRP
ncbi:MAG: metallophosphoesterase [Bacteroidota bacterium]